MKIQDDISSNLDEIVKQAGKILLSYFKSSSVEIWKKKDNSYVTKADLETEDFLKNNLEKILPNCSFWAEESGKTAKSDYCWVIDPLDGTSNFIHGIPFFCISIALTYLDDPIIGIIYDPIHNDFFYAKKDYGLFLNDRSITNNVKKEISESLITIGLPLSQNSERGHNYWKSLNNIRNKVFGLRITGSTALDQAYVACGRFDASFYFNIKWWDIAAGMLMVRQAGGVAFDLQGNNILPTSSSYISTIASIEKQLLNELRINI